MPRIRTIKPEFPHSESMGRVSREARLCFILLWTLADDAGRLRANSRMLASLLYPYDEDSRGLIESWLAELNREGCIIQYLHGNDSYIEICNWLAHQKIDRPSPSKLPSFDESSRLIAIPREPSSEDQDQDQGREGTGTKERTKDQDQGPAAPVGEGRKKRRTRAEILLEWPEAVRAVANAALKEWRKADPDGRPIDADPSKLCANLEAIFQEHQEVTEELLIESFRAYLKKARNRYSAPQWFFGAGTASEPAKWIGEYRTIVTRRARSAAQAEG